VAPVQSGNGLNVEVLNLEDNPVLGTSRAAWRFAGDGSWF
jgi:hypothetical protein